MNILVTDTETTGLCPVGSVDWRTGSKGTDRIAAFAFIALKDGEVVKSDYRLVNPTIPMPAAALAVNGLSDDKLANAPKFKEHAARIYAAFKWADVIVGHNVSFDLGFYKAEMKLASWDTGNCYALPTKPIVDTRLIAKDRFLFANNKLVTITSAWKIPHTAHNALGDCEATLAVLRRMMTEKYPHMSFADAVKSCARSY